MWKNSCLYGYFYTFAKRLSKANSCELSVVSNITSFFKGLTSRSVSSEDIERAVNEVLSDVPTAQIEVNQNTSLAITTVWACVTLLSESVGILPIHLYKKTPSGRSLVKAHPGLQVLNFPNHKAALTRMDLLQHLMVGATLWGNGYAQIIRDKKSQEPVSLILPHPNDVEPQVSEEGFLFYEVKGKKIPADDMIHIRGLVTDGYKGKSPIAVHRENLLLTLQVQSYGEKFFSKGGNTEGMFTIPGELKEDAFNRLKKDITSQYSGMTNAHKPMLLEGGLKYERLNIPPEDAQFLGTRKFQKSEIASIYRVPPHMVGDLERATYSNIEQQSQEFVTYCLMPYLVKIEQQLNYKLLPVEQMGKYYFKFALGGLLRADSKSRSEYYKNMNFIGCLNANEIRAMEELNSYEGGDEFFVQQNMMTVDNAIKAMNNSNETNKQQPTTEPTQEPTTEGEAGE